MDKGVREAMLSLGEAAVFLNLSRSTLYKYVETQALPHVKIGARIRFERAALEAWIAARRVPEAN